MSQSTPQIPGFTPDPELVKQLTAAVTGKEIFYCPAYNDGPDIGMRLYSGNEENPVGDVRLSQSPISWLIAADVYQFMDIRFRRLKSCSAVENAPIEELALRVRAQGMVNGKIQNFELGVFLVTERTIVRESKFGLLRVKK